MTEKIVFHPHPSFGFLTKAEFNQMHNACPVQGLGRKKELVKLANARKKAYLASKRKNK